MSAEMPVTAWSNGTAYDMAVERAERWRIRYQGQLDRVARVEAEIADAEQEKRGIVLDAGQSVYFAVETKRLRAALDGAAS